VPIGQVRPRLSTTLLSRLPNGSTSNSLPITNSPDTLAPRRREDAEPSSKCAAWFDLASRQAEAARLDELINANSAELGYGE